MASRPSHPAARQAKPAAAFKLTYATMFNPPEVLHKKFEAALADARAAHGPGSRDDHRRQGPLLAQ